MNKIKRNIGDRIFQVCNVLFLTLLILIGIVPFIHLLAVSLSSNAAASSGSVGLLPVNFTLESYLYLFSKSEFIRSFFISVERVILGTIVNMTLIILTAYPLSKEKEVFRARKFYVWFFVITMFFSGGMIPVYLIVKYTGLLNTIWALILPGALNVWNMILLLNFFRNVPKELEEAAIIDGANHRQILWHTYLPVSLPALATILLFVIIGHWNAWFDGILYLSFTDQYPLQSYLSTIVMTSNSKAAQVVSPEQLERMKNISDKSLKSAEIFMGALPIMLVYPFMQKYFIKGIVIGSVKG